MDQREENTIGVAVVGELIRRVRCVRTAEGWESAAFVLGEAASPGGRLLVVCSGPGAADIASTVSEGDEVLVVGRLRARRSRVPQHDLVELEAAQLLIRSTTGYGPLLPGRPRIAA